MATTTPHDRAEAQVPVGAIPAPRTTPRGPAPAAVALLTPPPAVTSPPAVPGTVPQQRPWAAAPVSAEPVELAPVAPFRTGRAPFGFLPPRTTRARPAAVMTTPADQRSSTSVSELAALLAIGAVATLGAVFVLITTAAAEPVVAAPPASVSPNVSVPGRVLSSFGDGVWQVGVDVEPGTYTSAGPLAGTACRHALGPTRTGGDVSTATASSGPGTVVLTADDGWFATSGCATWRRSG